MPDPSQDFSSPMTTTTPQSVGHFSRTAPSSYSDNGEFVPRLSEALENMDTELMHEIVTRECAMILCKKIDDFLTFLRRLSTGNKAIFHGVVKQSSVVQKLEAVKNEMESFSKIAGVE